MLTRVVDRLMLVVAPLVVVASEGQEVPPLPPNVAVVRDPQEGRGPLQGLATGLNALRGRCEAAYLTGCDAPFLVPEFVQRLRDLLGEASVCVPQIDGYFHPLAAIYRLEVAGEAECLVAAGKLRMTDLLARVAVREVSAAELADVDPTLQSLRNLNTKEDYESAVREEEERR